MNNTPVETYQLAGRPILVKREDLCAPPEAPEFSKMRGVWAHLKERPETTIGVLDTYHSKAGWAVAFCAALLGKKVINYWPKYKADKAGELREPQVMSKKLGATLVSLPAGRSAILYHTARRHLRENFKDAYLVPNALKLDESITENAAEVVATSELYPKEAALVISVSSGTVAAGVLKGLDDVGLLDNYTVYFHMGYSRSRDAFLKYVQDKSGLILDLTNVNIVDEGYNYSAAAVVDTPFPCNPYYDAKAWKWLQNSIEAGHPINEHENILFWNIGS